MQNPEGANKEKPKRGERKSAKKKHHKQAQEDEDEDQIWASKTVNGSKIRVSNFDYSAENHFRAMDVIYKLCGQEDYSSSFDESEIERFADSIIFLSEWRYFNYTSRIIRFVSETGLPSGGEAHSEITLPQFSSALVPQSREADEMSSDVASTVPRNDFVLYVGGRAWALDWCPAPDQGRNSDAKCEFIAVAAHPPDSTYHKLGACLSGRGMVQIWCILNCTSTLEDEQATSGNIKRKPHQKKNVAKEEVDKPKKPRGRPRKHPIDKTTASADSVVQCSQALVVHVPESTSDVPSLDGNMLNVPISQSMLDAIGNMKQSGQRKAVAMENDKPITRRGRPRKNATDKVPGIVEPEGQFIQDLPEQLPEDISNPPPVNGNLQYNPAPCKAKRKKRKAVTNEETSLDGTADVPDSREPLFEALAVEFPDNITTSGSHEGMGKMQKVPTKRAPTSDMEFTLSDLRKRSRKKSKAKNDLGHDNIKISSHYEGEEPSVACVQEVFSRKDDMVSEGICTGDSLFSLGSGRCHVQKDVVLPRVVFCLGHDGKVAWDVKWRPCTAHESYNKHRMGYLAVVLGNGSIEVWEIPSPQIIKCIYASQQNDATDPRFAKLKPVFRCSTLKSGDRQSIPLTVEWSLFPPHDLILAGCHDGVVALWKFSTDCSSEDARPLLCFSAETVPIRAISWAPCEGDPESKNVVVTAGHGGLKFWDLRDPFRPLWDANPSQHYVCALDWLPDPRCVIVSYDDGTLRILSLSRAAYDVPVTGEPFNGTLQQGLHSYYCSSFAIWSIHVSRLTGMVAYCCVDGTVLFFQLTHKAVDKDPTRNRAPHFLCGALADEGSAVAINTKPPTSPHLMKKSATEWANTPRSARTVISGLNQSKRLRKGLEKCENSDDKVLALCYENDLGDGDTNEAHRSVKGKTSKPNKANNDQALICTEGDGPNVNRKPEVKEDASGEIEVLPSKIVAVNSVRWNLNKGSERWLCYGGAAGIVRCQEIMAPVVDKKLLKK